MRITGKQLKNLVDSRVRRALHLRAMNENVTTFSNLIREADDALPPNPALKPELGDSVDAQIDKKLIEYEQTAKPSGEANESIDYRQLIHRMLREADEEPDAGGDDDLASALGGDDSTDEVANAKQLSLNDIDIYEFASNVARLIDNVENLLEFRDTIMKRSMNFLKKSYDASVLEQYTQVMDKQFDIVIGEDDVDKEFEITPPPAVGAGVPPGA